MRTVYLRRWTEDLREDMEVVKAANDFFIDCRDATANAGGLLELQELIRRATTVSSAAFKYPRGPRGEIVHAQS